MLVGRAALPLAAQTAGTCVPVAERGDSAFGCFVTAREELGALPAYPPLYWHLDAYPTAAAARSARGPRGTVVESLGRTWLFSIEPADYRPEGGRRVARVGSLPLTEAAAYAAVYMEGIFQPGMRSVVHRHPGVEAWFTLEGSMCLETPEGKLEQGAEEPGVLVAGGVPMVLTGTGTETRRSLVLILQDAQQPRSTPRPTGPRPACATPPRSGAQPS
jgi:quercetin dioxygenase-like cupin family protein